MSVETDQRADEDTATSDSWLARLVAFIAWLLDSIANLKRIRRTTRFKPEWRDGWDNLRQLEWHRHQMLAQGAALLLSGGTLNDADYIDHPMPADFGGPCPHTPFEMNRRILAVMTFIRDPESHIRRHTQRIAKRAGIALNGDPLRLACKSTRSTSPTCVASEGGNSRDRRILASLSRTATGGVRRGPRSGWIGPVDQSKQRTPGAIAKGSMRASCAHDGGGLSANRARAPPNFPYSLLPTAYSLSATARLRSPPLARTPNQSYHRPHDHSRHPSTQVAGRQAACAGASLTRQGRRRTAPATLVPTDLSATRRRTSGETR